MRVNIFGVNLILHPINKKDTRRIKNDFSTIKLIVILFESLHGMNVLYPDTNYYEYLMISFAVATLAPFPPNFCSSS